MKLQTLFLGICLGFTSLIASSISVGSPLSELNNYKFETPTSQKIKVPQTTKTVILAFSKGTGALVNDFLAAQDKLYLQKHHAIYIADIHNVPYIIAILIAIPKLKKHKHLIYLHDGDEFQKEVPNEEDKVTLLKFENNKVSEISFITTQDALQIAIQRKK